MSDIDSVESINQDEIIRVSTFYLDDTLCGIDINLVQEINDDLSLTKVPLSPDYVMGIMNLRGQIVTVIDQGKKIGFSPSEINNDKRVVIVKFKDEYIGLVVDEIKEVIAMDKKKINAPPSNIKGVQGKFFKGVVETDTNELLALLDVEAILGMEE